MGELWRVVCMADRCTRTSYCVWLLTA